MSFCRQIPGCFLSPTGANCSTESTVGQPLISATWDSQDERLCQHLMRVPIRWALSTHSTQHQAGSIHTHSQSQPTGCKSTMQAACLVLLPETCATTFPMLNGLRGFCYSLPGVYCFKFKLYAQVVRPN